ncbi:MAG: hypothetical protein ACLQD8_08150 [Thermoplasmata archaeon]
MSGKAGSKRRIVAAGTALMVVVGLLAAFAGTVSAAPVAPAGSATVAWAYGGQNASGGSEDLGHHVTATWSASVGVDVIFNATPTVANTTELEAQRTVGVTIQIVITTPNGSLAFNYKALETDTAYANITNASSVNVSGAMVPALGIDNSSFHGTASLAESLVAKFTQLTASAYLNVSASANAQVQFAPALGLVPLNLDGVTAWSSNATASPSANWNISYAYAFHGWNNTTATGQKYLAGSWVTSGPIYLNGQVFTLGLPAFRDHAPRVGILLTVSGPANIYDGFIVIPRGFDLFGGAPHDYSSESMSNVTISGEALYLNTGHVRATSLTASKLTVGGADGKVPLVVAPKTPSAVPATSAIGGSVVAQPESVSAAQSQSNCLVHGCSSAAPWFSGLVAAALIGALIAAVVGTVGVVEWRSYARRKNRATQLVGGYGEGLTGGLPSAVVQPPAPAPPVSGPSNNDGPARQL